MRRSGVHNMGDLVDELLPAVSGDGPGEGLMFAAEKCLLALCMEVGGPLAILPNDFVLNEMDDIV